MLFVIPRIVTFQVHSSAAVARAVKEEKVAAFKTKGVVAMISVVTATTDTRRTRNARKL